MELSTETRMLKRLYPSARIEFEEEAGVSSEEELRKAIVRYLEWNDRRLF